MSKNRAKFFSMTFEKRPEPSIDVSETPEKTKRRSMPPILQSIKEDEVLNPIDSASTNNRPQ